MTRKTFKMLCAALAVTTLPACEELREKTQVRGVDLVRDAPDPTDSGDCITCLKWTAKPPSGVNAPPLKW